MMSKDFDDLLGLLKESGYEIKHGKYISVKPENGGSFIRLKSLGEYYSEQALRNRLLSALRTAACSESFRRKEKVCAERSRPAHDAVYTISFTIDAHVVLFCPY